MARRRRDGRRWRTTGGGATAGDVPRADSLAINTLLPPGKGGNFNYSPDGTKIVISTPTDISLINNDGTNQQYVLSYDQVTTYSEYRFYVDVLWARDSTSLRLAIPPSDPMAEPVQETALWLIPVDQTQAYQLGKVIAQPFFISKVTFSPDLLHIIFQRETGSPSENRVDALIANSDGQGERIYQSGISINFLGWSPDSNHFIFSHGENNIAQLGSLEVTAKPLTKSPAGILKVSWIDENYFIIVRENISAMDLVLSSRDGDELLIDSFTGAIPLYDFTKEIVARIHAVLRRPGGGESSRRIAVGTLVIDLDKIEVTAGGVKAELTATEFKILQLLASRRGRVFTRDQILDFLWGTEKAVVDRTVDVHIRNLREKLGPAAAVIKNIRGMGYKLEE